MTLCYRDRTFCRAECATENCSEKLTDDVRAGARRWWHHDPDNAPIAVGNFSATCLRFKEPAPMTFRIIVQTWQPPTWRTMEQRNARAFKLRHHNFGMLDFYNRKELRMVSWRRFV